MDIAKFFNRRIILLFQRDLQVLGDQYVFEPNNTITRRKITDVVKHICDKYVDSGLFLEYSIITDETFNTKESILEGKLNVVVQLEMPFDEEKYQIVMTIGGPSRDGIFTEPKYSWVSNKPY